MDEDDLVQRLSAHASQPWQTCCFLHVHADMMNLLLFVHDTFLLLGGR